MDANYHETIEQSGIFGSVLRYHEDGVAYWQETGLHHPFLDARYTGDGRRYHRQFAKIGIDSRHAARISFVELLEVPTVGRSVLTVADLNPHHLAWLDTAMRHGTATRIFVSHNVLKLMRASAAFSWLPDASAFRATADDALRAWRYDDRRTIFLHLHFSVYGKFAARSAAEGKAMAALIDRQESPAGPRLDGLDPPGVDEFKLPPHSPKKSSTTMSIAHLLEQQIESGSVRVVGSYTEPRSWGVYDLDRAAGTSQRFRFGNHPIRQVELENEFGACRLHALFTTRNDAAALADILNRAGAAAD